MEISLITPTLSLPPFHKSTLSSKTSSFVHHPTSRVFQPAHMGLQARNRNRTLARKGLVCNSLFGLGVPELAVIAGVAALVFGPKQLPEIGKNLGKTIKSFQQAAKEFEQELKNPEEAESPDNVVESKSVSESSVEKENVVSSSKDGS